MSIRALLIAFSVITIVLPPPPVKAQTPAPAPARGRLSVTVADQSGAVIPGAKVAVVGQEEATRTAIVPPAQSGTDGMAAIENLAPGRYTIQVEFPGFETVQVRDFRVRAGDNRRGVTLPIRKLSEDVTVGRDGQTASLDPRGNAFSTVLTREQIEMLPDDPDEMEAVLKAMAPPGATLRVDGFTGGRLPPKSQIRSIRLPRMDQYAAQNHGGAMGMMFIDIMTQPGNGPLRGSIDATFRDDALNARNPFTPVKGVESLKQGGASLSGTIVPNRSSFSFTAQNARQYDSGSLFAATPNDTTARAILQPTRRQMYTGRFDQAINKDHALRFSFTRNAFDRANLGIGGYDFEERAYSTESSDNIFRVSENGPIGRRFFSESRLQVRWANAESLSVIEAPTVRVIDAFTRGGAQQAGGRRAIDVEAATDLDYVRGSHSYRFGVLIEGGSYRSDESSNYLGTFTFANQAAFEAGRPSNYSRRVGDPNINYTNLQFGVYVQDDYRIARSLLLSYGLRYEAQNLIADQNNFSPRFTATWSPFRNGKTTFRSGVGYFTDWVGTGVYEQTLRVDGYRQREINIANPSYPDPGESGVAPPTNRYQLSPALILPENLSLNGGVDRQISNELRVSATYTYRQGTHVLRGRNLNAPVDGVRPDSEFANVVEVVHDGQARSHVFGVNASFIKINWRQTFFTTNYTFTSNRANSTGAFGLSPSGDDLSTEWAEMAPRHRAGVSFNMQPIPNLSVSLNALAQSGAPYNITTGFDINGDGVFNDRPEGVGRNTARATSQFDVGGRVSYAIGFGTRGASGGGGSGTVVVMSGGGSSPMGGFGGGANDKRYRIEFYASAQNLTNRANYIGFSGVVGSRYFMQPTNVRNPRKVELGARFGF